MNNYTICVRGYEFNVEFFRAKGSRWVCVWTPEGVGQAVDVEICGRGKAYRSIDHFVGKVIGEYISCKIQAILIAYFFILRRTTSKFYSCKIFSNMIN